MAFKDQVRWVFDTKKINSKITSMQRKPATNSQASFSTRFVGRGAPLPRGGAIPQQRDAGEGAGNPASIGGGRKKNLSQRKQRSRPEAERRVESGMGIQKAAGEMRTVETI